jgi:hypothetical protein
MARLSSIGVVMQKNIVQMKNEGNRLRKEAEFCYDMAVHYAPGIMMSQGDRYSRRAREADALFRERREALREKWGRFSR